jgi:hypothetical protein
MNARYPLYEGDSIIRPQRNENQPHLNGDNSASDGIEMVHRDNTPVGEYKRIEGEARALRQNLLRQLAERLWIRLEKSFARAQWSGNEAALSKATDHADLERRLRRLERGRFAT